jgi:Flp pilus assembly protein TadD
MMAALEDTGMECVSDYVQSTSLALKRPMFLRAAEAFTLLGTLRPEDSSVQSNALFCRARANIAAGEFIQAVDSLKRSLSLEPDFACSHNALGVALSRLGRNREARAAFEKAAELAPAWALPPLQLAQQSISAGDIRGAVPYLKKAANLNPKAVGIYWSLARAHRLLGNTPEFLRVANAAAAIDRNYAPIYFELGLFHESAGDMPKAVQAYDTYLLLAPNFPDSTEVRKRMQAIRTPAQPRPQRRAPTLRRSGETKR